jgi:hypothetical protein
VFFGRSRVSDNRVETRHDDAHTERVEEDECEIFFCLFFFVRLFAHQNSTRDPAKATPRTV